MGLPFDVGSGSRVLVQPYVPHCPKGFASRNNMRVVTRVQALIEPEALVRRLDLS
jgi:hypothetical protein